MPIEGISDIVRLPRIGKIRLGKKVKNSEGKEYPEKTEYFIFDPDDESIDKEILAEYGPKPKAIDVMFAVDDQEQVFPQYLKRYSFNTLICKGNGKDGTESLFVKDSKGVTKRTGEKVVQCVGCPYNDKKRCKPVGNLMVMLPKIPGIGVWQCDTGSFHSIVGINAGLRLVKQLYGRISGIPIKLLLNPRSVKADGRAEIVYVMSLSIEGTLQQALKEGVQGALQIEETATKAALMPKPDESHDEILLADSDVEVTEEVEEQPIEETPIPKEEPKVEQPKQVEEKNSSLMIEKRHIFMKNAHVLGYTADQMIAYIFKSFGVKKSDVMSSDELDIAIKHLGNIIFAVEAAKGIFEHKELEEYAKGVCKVDNMLMMKDIDIERMVKLNSRAAKKDKQ